MSIKQTDRAFGLTFSAVFTIIGSFIWYASGNLRLWPFIVAVAFAVLALLSPGMLLPLNRLWSWFGSMLGTFNNKLILGIFYILFMVPFGFVLRLVGRDPMGRTTKKGQDTYWKQPTRQLDRETLQDMY